MRKERWKTAAMYILIVYTIRKINWLTCKTEYSNSTSNRNQNANESSKAQKRISRLKSTRLKNLIFQILLNFLYKVACTYRWTYIQWRREWKERVKEVEQLKTWFHVSSWNLLPFFYFEQFSFLVCVQKQYWNLPITTKEKTSPMNVIIGSPIN